MWENSPLNSKTKDESKMWLLYESFWDGSGSVFEARQISLENGKIHDFIMPQNTFKAVQCAHSLHFC